MAAPRRCPPASESIVAVADIVPLGQMVGTIGDVTHKELVREILHDLQDPIPTIGWLARNGLLANTHSCSQHQAACRLNRSNGTRDLWEWRCAQHNCHYKVSIRHNSFWTNSHLSFGTGVEIVYCWSIEFSIKHLKRECEIESDHTCIDWFKFLGDICMQFAEEQQAQIGGVDANEQGKFVELDESKFMDRNYHRGQFRGHCVLGGVERETTLCFLDVCCPIKLLFHLGNLLIFSKMF